MSSEPRPSDDLSGLPRQSQVSDLSSVTPDERREGDRPPPVERLPAGRPPRTSIWDRDAFDPDIILPSQRTARFIGPGYGAKRLMLAVLADAWDCVHQPPRTTGRTRERERVVSVREKALRWFYAKPSGGLYDFETICGYLQWEPESIRARLPARPDPIYIPIRQTLQGHQYRGRKTVLRRRELGLDSRPNQE